MTGKLTPKQAVFVQEYLIDLNGTQAAIRAGYSEDSARQMGSENLSKPYIKESIDIALDARARRTEITADRVLSEIAKLALYNVQDLLNDSDGSLKAIHDIERDVTAAITEITTKTISKDGDDLVLETKVKLSDKGQNLERLGKHLKLFTDKVDVGGQGDNPLTITEITRTLVKPSS